MSSSKGMQPTSLPVISKGTTTLKPPQTQTKGAPAKRATSGEERRRSHRVLLRVRATVHVVWQGAPVTFEVITLSVNSHGALIAMERNLPIETRLVIEHADTKQRMACRVVRTPRDTPEGFHTAVEFDSPAPGFWGIAFPPADWRPDDV